MRASLVIIISTLLLASCAAQRTAYTVYSGPSDFYYPNYAFSGPYPYTSLTAYRRFDPYMFDPGLYGYRYSY